MSATWLGSIKFYRLLEKVDGDIAELTRAEGCWCGTVVHSARYPRKPRGGPAELADGKVWRYSFCCAKDGCRCRSTPPSVRFLGRKVYLGFVVVLVTALRCGLTPWRVAQLREHIGPVSLRTLQRWREFWQTTFVATDFWREAKSRFMPLVDELLLPASLLERFLGDRGLELAMRFLSPITTTWRPAGARDS